jgi:hypothetical protein
MTEVTGSSFATKKWPLNCAKFPGTAITNLASTQEARLLPLKEELYEKVFGNLDFHEPRRSRALG